MKIKADLFTKVEFLTDYPPRYGEKPADPFGEKPRREPTDLRKAECPSCHRPLKKVPAVKTKCPHCGEVMFVRTRPEDFARVVATRAEAVRIETDYRILSGAREPDFRHLATEEEVTAERERLNESFGRKGCAEPSDDDVKWSLLSQNGIQHANDWDFGLSRNIYYTMAEFLVRRWRLREALEFYVYVSILDLNGATNASGHKNSPELLRQFPAFDPNHASLAPAVLDQIARIVDKLRIGTDDLRAIIEKRYANKFPLSAEECWSRLEKILKPNLGHPLGA